VASASSLHKAAWPLSVFFRKASQHLGTIPCLAAGNAPPLPLAGSDVIAFGEPCSSLLPSRVSECQQIVLVLVVC